MPRPPLFAVTLLILFLLGCQEEQEKPYIIKVGDNTLTKEDLLALVPPHLSRDSALIASKTIRAWVQRELLYSAAVERGLTGDLGVEQQVEAYRKSVYGNAFLDIYLSAAVDITPEELREKYTKNRDQYRRRREEVKLLHFLLSNEVEANEVKKSLLQYRGEVRQSLMASYDVNVKTVSQGDLIPELDKVIFGTPLARGVLGPIRSEHGYHMLEVLERYPRGTYRGLDEVYDEVSQSIFREKSAAAYAHLMDSLLTQYPVITSSGVSLDWRRR